MTRETNHTLAAAGGLIALAWASHLAPRIAVEIVESLPATGLVKGENSDDAVKVELLVDDGLLLDEAVHARIQAVTGLRYSHIISYREEGQRERTHACVFVGNAMVVGVGIAADVPVEAHLRVKRATTVA